MNFANGPRIYTTN